MVHPKKMHLHHPMGLNDHTKRRSLEWPQNGGIPLRQTYVWQRWQRWPVNRHQMAADPNAVLSKWQAKLLQLPAVSRDI